MFEMDISPFSYPGRSSALQTKPRKCWIQMQNINQQNITFVRWQLQFSITITKKNLRTCLMSILLIDLTVFIQYICELFVDFIQHICNYTVLQRVLFWFFDETFNPFFVLDFILQNFCISL